MTWELRDCVLHCRKHIGIVNAMSINCNARVASVHQAQSVEGFTWICSAPLQTYQQIGDPVDDSRRVIGSCGRGGT